MMKEEPQKKSNAAWAVVFLVGGIILGIMLAFIFDAFFSVSEVASLRKQLSDAKERIKELEKMVPVMKRGEWNSIANFTGTTSKTTETFYIPGDEWMIFWAYRGTLAPVFSFDVYREGEAIPVESVASSLELARADYTYIHNGKGRYYIKVISEPHPDPRGVRALRQGACLRRGHIAPAEISSSTRPASKIEHFGRRS